MMVLCSVEIQCYDSNTNHRAKMKKQPFRQVLFSVLIWPLLEVPSLHFFCSKLLSTFIDGGKDVL